LRKIHNITGKHEPVTTATSQDTILENHSPGISPNQSLSTLTIESFQPTITNKTQQIEEPTDNQEPVREEPIVNPAPIREEPHPPIDIILAPTPPPEPKKCPVCNYEFAATSEDIDMYDHIEKCLFPTGIHTEPKDYECPNCTRKYPGNDEGAYLQHLSDCFNRD
jgi:hypothetical protein